MTPDKLKHFAVGALLAILGLLHSPLTALLLPLWGGALKEAYDKLSGRGTPEFADAIWTWIGGMLPVVVYLAWAAT
jgi:hypothetical protein